jgi:hypothetical protein
VSGDTVEQSSDEPRLGPDVAAIDVSNLPFPYHRHRLIACQRSTRCPESAKTEPWIGQSFHVPMVLFEACLVLGAASPVHRGGMRARSNSTLALPYMARFNVFSLLICPSAWPLLQRVVSAFCTASRSCWSVRAKRCIA